MPELLQPELGKRIRALREADPRNISLGKLAEMTGLGKGHLSYIEAGQRKPKFENLEKIATALRIPIEELTGSEGGAISEERARYEVPSEVADAQINLLKIGELDEEEYRMLLRHIAERRQKVERDHGVG